MPRLTRRRPPLPGVLLLAATLSALLWANSPWSGAYDDLRHARHWVNDGLMPIFFLLVGLEIKREMTSGALRDLRAARLPLAAAIGGMVMPALIYVALNPSGAAARGWGIPMATDIAFALGVLAVVAPRIPSGARLFLLTLAIVDDIGAIAVIAVFYSDEMSIARLTTVAAVAVGLLLPAAGRLEHRLQPFSSLFVVPLFALVNAGVRLDANAVRDAFASPVARGVVLALVIGKTLGITVGAEVALRLGWADLPAETRRQHIVGLAALGGIGFTVSLFVTELAFGDSTLATDAKVGVLCASLLASLLGALILRRAAATR